MLEAKWLLAKTFFHTDDHQKAIDLSSQIIIEGEKTNNYKIVADVYWRLGHHNVFRRDFQKGKEYFQYSLEFSKKINDKNNIANSMCGLAWIYAEEGSSSDDKIINMFESGLAIYDELEDNNAGVGTNVDLGYYYCVAVGQVDKSLFYIKRALKLAEEFGSKSDLSIGYLGIGFYHFFVGDYEKCDKYYNKSLELGTEIGDHSLMSLMNQCLGESYFFQSKYEESLSYFEKAYDIAIKINLKIWITGALQGIALCKQTLGLEVDYDTINLDKEKRMQEKTGVRVNAYYDDYLYFMIFKENQYLQSAFDKLNNISNKLNEKDRKNLLKCPWPKMIIAEWEKHHS
jgi:tetratricopeptide (TPR) repeat protein